MNNMKLDFYYYSYQCPLNTEMLRLLNTYTDRLEIHTYDIAENFELAKRLNIFFPTLIVLDNQYRYYSPLKKEFLEDVCSGIIPKEVPYRPVLGNVYVEQIIEPLTKENICIACNCCGTLNQQIINAKIDFINHIPGEIYGYIHKTQDNQLLGGVEYLPSIYIPYNVPHDDKTTFITCLYCSDTKYDFKSAPLRKLEEHLSHTYERIIVVTDEEGIFPNGNMKFFIKNGYMDEGVIYRDSKYCKLHLMSKML